MTNLPEPEEDDARDLVNSPADDVAIPAPAPVVPVQLAPDSTSVSYAAPIGLSDPLPIAQPDTQLSAPAIASPNAEPLLFQSFAQPLVGADALPLVRLEHGRPGGCNECPADCGH
jgi:hypothetical protein